MLIGSVNYFEAAFMQYIRGFVGLAVLVGLAYLISRNKKAINWQLVAIGITLQLLAGLLILKVPFVQGVFNHVSKGFVTFLSFSQEGARFIFGELTDVSSFGFHFWLSGAAYHHFFLVHIRRAVLPGRVAEDGIWYCLDNGPHHAAVRSREPVGGGQHFPGPNRSTLVGAPLHRRYDFIRTDVPDDRRDGDYFGERCWEVT